MRFGVMLPHSNNPASTSAILRAAEVAEELGFDALCVHDHIQFDGGSIAAGSHHRVPGGDVRNLFEPMSTLAFVAGRTTRARLMTTILLLPVREPILLAKQAATVDVLSGGRFVCGVAVGPPLKEKPGETTRLTKYKVNAVKEYAAFGLRGHRGRRMDEYLQAMIAIWTQEQATFKGRYVSFEAIDVFPKPLQKPRPPIWIGGRSEHAIERAAASGDAWFPSQINPKQFADGVRLLRERFAARRRPLPSEYGVNIFTCTAATDDEADRLARPVLESKFYDEHDYRTRTIIGSPDATIRSLKEWEGVGLTFCQIKPIYHTLDDLVAQLRLLAREVMPAFPEPAAQHAAAAGH